MVFSPYHFNKELFIRIYIFIFPMNCISADYISFELPMNCYAYFYNFYRYSFQHSRDNTVAAANVFQNFISKDLSQLHPDLALPFSAFKFVTETDSLPTLYNPRLYYIKHGNNNFLRIDTVINNIRQDKDNMSTVHK